MGAQAKTDALSRVNLKTTQLEGNPANPNEMSDAEFNLLYDNIEQMGFTDPLLVRPLGGDRYRIIGGHHRWEVAKLLGLPEVPCTVVTDPEFDADQETFQMVRMNTIRGHLSPQKFIQMYQSLAPKYADEVMRESFGFANDEDFAKLVASVKKTLPKDLQPAYTKAAKELKTITDLSKLLHKLFLTYGNTLPYGYMLMDFGGKESVWLRMDPKTKKALLAVCAFCVAQHRTVDDIIGGLLRLAAAGTLSAHLGDLVQETPDVQIPEGTQMPTIEVLKGAISEG